MEHQLGQQTVHNLSTTSRQSSLTRQSSKHWSTGRGKYSTTKVWQKTCLTVFVQNGRRIYKTNKRNKLIEHMNVKWQTYKLKHSQIVHSWDSWVKDHTTVALLDIITCSLIITSPINNSNIRKAKMRKAIKCNNMVVNTVANVKCSIHAQLPRMVKVLV